jgi:hypothetical protein
LHALPVKRKKKPIESRVGLSVHSGAVVSATELIPVAFLWFNPLSADHDIYKSMSQHP